MKLTCQIQNTKGHTTHCVTVFGSPLMVKQFTFLYNSQTCRTNSHSSIKILMSLFQLPITKYYTIKAEVVCRRVPKNSILVLYLAN